MINNELIVGKKIKYIIVIYIFF